MPPPPVRRRSGFTSEYLPRVRDRKSLRACFILGLATLRGEEPPASAPEHLGFKFDPPKASAPATATPVAVPVPLPPGVILMPEMKVGESRMPPKKEAIASPAEKLAGAKRKYLSPLYPVTFGPLSQLAGYAMNFLTIGSWHPGDDEAKVLFLQDARLQKMREFDETVALLRLADPAEAKKLQGLRAELFRLKQNDETKFYRRDIQQGDQPP